MNTPEIIATILDADTVKYIANWAGSILTPTFIAIGIGVRKVWITLRPHIIGFFQGHKKLLASLEASLANQDKRDIEHAASIATLAVTIREIHDDHMLHREEEQTRHEEIKKSVDSIRLKIDPQKGTA